MEHSKLPWKSRDNNVTETDYCGAPIAVCYRANHSPRQDIINAEFIITACNSFKDLLDLAENIAKGVDIDQGGVQRLVDEIKGE